MLAEGQLAQFGDAVVRGFVRIGLADAELNGVNHYEGAGLVLQGPISGHPDDRFGIAFARAYFNDDAPELDGLESYELAVEANYELPVTDWLTLQPNVQRVCNPGGDAPLDDAWVVGTRLVISAAGRPCGHMGSPEQRHVETTHSAIVGSVRSTFQAALKATLGWTSVLRLAAALVASFAMQAASAHAHQHATRADAPYEAQGRGAAYDRAVYAPSRHWLTYARLRTHAEGRSHEEIALPPDTRARSLIAVHRRTDVIAALVQYPDGRRARLASLEGAVNGTEEIRARLKRPACRQPVLQLVHRSARDGKRATYDLLVQR